MPYPPPAPLPDHHRVTRALAVAGLLIVSITLVLAGLLFSSYYSTVEREQTNLRNLAAAFAAQTHYATLALDMTLARDAERALHGPDATHDALAGAMPDDMPTQVYVLAPDGRLRAAEPPLPPGARPPAPARTSASANSMQARDAARSRWRARCRRARAQRPAPSWSRPMPPTSSASSTPPTWAPAVR